jgi:hypothetical protein
MRKEVGLFMLILTVFLGLYFLPVEQVRFQGAVIEAFRLARWYAREHVLLCLVPAFFIAGAIAVFVSRNAVVSGSILAVCSCTVLPLFSGIYSRGAGLGPAVAFLYSGPAINVLAIVLTANVLGWELGVARAVGAVLFSVVIGLLMHLIFLREERQKIADAQAVHTFNDEEAERPLWQTGLFFASMVGVLVFANWSRPDEAAGVWFLIYRSKWVITAVFAVGLGVALRLLFQVGFVRLAAAAVLPLIAGVLTRSPIWTLSAGAAGIVFLTVGGDAELDEWRGQTWRFAKQILPLLLAGVFVAGFLLGSPESSGAGIIPNHWVESLVGERPDALVSLTGWWGGEAPGWLNGLWPIWSNFFASVAGAFMYFATLTEVPILRGLLDSGMGQGPALALLLAGPALSLPNMLVINSVLGPRKTLTFVSLVVVMATISGILFGWMMG